jgi:hypothetical protein
VLHRGKEDAYSEYARHPEARPTRRPGQNDPGRIALDLPHAGSTREKLVLWQVHCSGYSDGEAPACASA